MTISVHIDRLIVEGLDVPFGSGDVLGEAVRGELGRLIRMHGLIADAGFSTPIVRAPQVRAGSCARGLGAAIGGAVYAGVKEARP
jgi:hypothetical protein